MLKRAVLTFGNGDCGRLGLGSQLRSIEIPTVITSLLDVSPSSVAAGGAHTAIVTDEGSVLTFGLNSHGQLGHSEGSHFVSDPAEVPLPEPAIAVATGHYHTLCISESGRLWAWGSNESGQLGFGKDSAPISHEPRLISSLRDVKIKDCSAGAEHSAAVTTGGELFSWGCGDHGRLGHGTPQQLQLWGRHRIEWKPRLVRSVLETAVVNSVSTGHMHTSIVTDDSRAFLFGSNRYHQLGVLSSGRGGAGMPSDIDDAEVPSECVDGGVRGNVAQIACGGHHTLVRLLNGRTFSFGANQNGCLGLGRKHAGPSKVPTLIPGLSGVEHISAGWKHSAALTAGGRLYLWGWNGSQGTAMSFEEAGSGAGQLGLGNDFDYWEPARVEKIVGVDGEMMGKDDGWRVVHVSCGLNHTVAVVELDNNK